MESKVVQKKIRASTKHSRTGCSTCRTRRVKCDETKPSCIRCQRFKVECDGYGRRSHRTHNRPLSLAPKLLPKYPDWQPRQPDVAAPLFSSDLDARYFNHFINVSLFELVPYCPGASWVIIGKCYSVPSIRHATIALGALHHTLLAAQDLRPQRSIDSYDAHHVRAIKHYDLALRSLRQELENKEMDLGCALLSCLLTFGFEAFHGNIALAESQILSGLNLISAWEESQAAGGQTDLGLCFSKTDVSHYMVQFFGRLEIQTHSIHGKRRANAPRVTHSVGVYDIRRMPACFADVHEAQSYLHVVLKRAEVLLSMAGMIMTPANPDEVTASEAAEKRLEAEGMQVTILKQSKLWKGSFDALFQELEDGNGTCQKQGLLPTVLLLHFKTNYLMLAGVLFEDLTGFDSLTSTFEEILELSTKLLSLINSASTTARFNFDLGSILPLYHVALKCRVKSIRERAIRLLIDDPRREGLWDSVFAGRVASWVRGLEEACEEGGEVPGWARIRHVDSDFDLQRRYADSICLQRVRSGDGFVVVERKARIEW